jgi:hypothetical protein
MTALEELLLAAEALAGAVDDSRDLAGCSALEREDFDSDEEFLFAVEDDEDDRKAAAARLVPRFGITAGRSSASCPRASSAGWRPAPDPDAATRGFYLRPTAARRRTPRRISK